MLYNFIGSLFVVKVSISAKRLKRFTSTIVVADGHYAVSKTIGELYKELKEKLNVELVLVEYGDFYWAKDRKNAKEEIYSGARIVITSESLEKLEKAHNYLLYGKA